MQSNLARHPGPPAPARPLLQRTAIRRLEQAALQATGPGVLMRRAGLAVAEACRAALQKLPADTPVVALVGPGHNGGDALYAALQLAQWGHAVAAVALDPTTQGSPDRCEAQRAWQAHQGPVADPEALADLLQRGSLVIDGLFGIGLTRPLSERAMHWAALSAQQAIWVVAVDVPSGLDADTGAPLGPGENPAIRADCTVTLLADKPGLHTGAGRDYAGQVIVADLGIADCARTGPPTPNDAAKPAAEVGEWVSAPACIGLLPARAHNSHKGLFGDALVIMGAATMRGAGILAALGAQAVGAGRIYLGESSMAPPWPLYPEFLQRHLDSAHPDAWVGLGAANAIVMGCGLGDGADASRMVTTALAHPAALVLDADALNLLSANPAWQSLLHTRDRMGRCTVMTPHPLEAARLLGHDSAARVQSDRVTHACLLAQRYQAIVVLKGAGTVMAEPGGKWSINGSGHPILAVAGTGDVLAGALAGLLAQGLPPPDAVRLAVWLHGAAGQALAADPGWQAGIGLRASELAQALRVQINQCSAGLL